MHLPPYRYRVIPIFAGVVIVSVVIVLQILNLRSQIHHHRKKRKKKKPRRKKESPRYTIFVYVFGVMICNYYNLVMGIFASHAWPNCDVCQWSISSISIVFVVGRVFNYLFFIQVVLMYTKIHPFHPLCHCITPHA